MSTSSSSSSSPSSRKDNKTDAREGRIPSPASGRVYPCKRCPLTFPTPMALGGHQNAHRGERQAEKERAEANKLNPSSLPILESPPSPISSLSRQWLEQFPVTQKRRRIEDHASQMMFGRFSPPMVRPSVSRYPSLFFPPGPVARSSAPMSPPPPGLLPLFSSAPMTPSRSAPVFPRLHSGPLDLFPPAPVAPPQSGPLDLFPQAPVAPPQSAPSVSAPPPARMGPPALAPPPAARPPMLHNFFGPPDAAGEEEEEEEEVDLDLDLNL